jgi:hypothetical protein
MRLAEVEPSSTFYNEITGRAYNYQLTFNKSWLLIVKVNDRLFAFFKGLVLGNGSISSNSPLPSSSITFNSRIVLINFYVVSDVHLLTTGFPNMNTANK